MTDTIGAPIDWAKASGDIWAQRWRDTDRGLEPLQSRLVSAVAGRLQQRPSKAFDIGCGPGSTTIAVANACPEASIIACDISEALAGIASQRTAEFARVKVVVGDAESVAAAEAPTDLFFSRHGVMFFDDPARAFRGFRSAARGGASFVFSCFQDWELNPWASELASAAAGRVLPPPGRESGGFAFADRNYVSGLFKSAGWTNAEARSAPFSYVMGEGENAVDYALSFMIDIGPASRIVQSLPDEDRPAAVQRMRTVIERHFDGAAVEFPAAAWIWSATAS